MKYSSDLELAELASVIYRGKSPDKVNSKAMSKEAQLFLKAAKLTREKVAIGPLPMDSVILAATVNGMSHEDAVRYAGKITKHEHSDGALRLHSRKVALADTINRASQMLGEDDPNLDELITALTRANSEGTEPLLPMSEWFAGDEWIDPPQGLNIPSMPALVDYTGGLQGIWIIGGEPGIGKSSLAMQIALDTKAPCLYYDIDGTGRPEIERRLVAIYGRNRRKLRDITKHIIYRTDINFTADLATIGPGAVVVVDSIQALPVYMKDRRASLDSWLVRFKEIARQGFPMILVSEKAREFYGAATLAGYKETGGIEYAGNVCIQLVGEPGRVNEPIDIYIVKNRSVAGRGTGLVSSVIRNERGWFEECEDNFSIYDEEGAAL